MLLQAIDDRLLVGIAIAVLARVDVDGLETCLAGARQTGRLAAIGNHHCDVRIELAVRDRVDDRLEIGAPARNEDPDAARGGS